jgi:DNA polymerase-3 subunit delta
MVAVKAADADAFVARPDPRLPVILVFGPDTGLVHERAAALIRAAVGDIGDPFALAHLGAEELAADPARLAEEAQTIPLLGTARAVWVRAASRVNIVPAVEAVLALPRIECRVVIEAGDLRGGTALRSLCERARNAAAIPCYPDDERTLARLVDAELRAAGLTISAEARALLLPLLGADRQASRSELQKLTLYAAGRQSIDTDDVIAIVSNAAPIAVEAVVDAAFAGRPRQVESEFAKLVAAGFSGADMLGQGLRQAGELHRLRLDIEAGTAVEAAVERIHFRRRALVATALRSWTSDRLVRALTDLATAVLESRRQPMLDQAIANRALLAIALAGRRGA